MFDNWEAKFNDVKEWAIPEPGSWLTEEEGKKRDAEVKARKGAAATGSRHRSSNSSGGGRNASSTAQATLPAVSASSIQQRLTPRKIEASSRDVGTASKARRPTKKSNGTNEELPIVQPSCNDFSAWAFLSRDLFLTEEADGISVSHNPSSVGTSATASTVTARGGNLNHRRTASKGSFAKPSIFVDTPRTEPSGGGINPPPPTPEGSVRPPSTTGHSLRSLGSLLPTGGRTRAYLGSPVNEDAPTEYAVRGSPSPTKSPGLVKASSLFRSKKRRDAALNNVDLDTTVDLDDSFSSSEGSDSPTSMRSKGEDMFVDDFTAKSEFAAAASTEDEGESKQEDYTKRQLNILQSVRWLSAMHIICYHFLTDTGNARWDSFAAWGATQLTYFFMLSGFILAYQYTDRGIGNVGKFLFKRWARLYPTYLLSIVVQCIALPKIGIPVDAGALVSVLFSLTTWIARYFLNYINTPGWSVGAFLFQYTLFPTLLKPIARAGQATRFKKLLPACWIYSILEAGHAMGIDISLFKPFNWIMLPPHTGSFMFGIVLGCAFVESEKQSSTRIPASVRNFGLSIIVIAAVILFVFVDVKSVPSILYYWTSHGMFMPLFALVIWLGALETDCLLRHWLSLKPFLLLGQVSFTVYILQGCAYTYSTYWIGPWLNRQFGLRLNYDYVFLVVVNVVGFLVHFIFEQPSYNALLFLDKRNDSQPAVDGPAKKTRRPRKKQVSGFRRTFNTFISYEWVRIIAYYVLMILSVGGYVALSISTSYIDWTGMFAIKNDFVAELSINIVKCCFFLASPALLFGFAGHLIWSPAKRVKVPSLEESVAANDLQARLFFRIVTRGKNPDLVKCNVITATNVLRKTCLPEWQWKVEVATDNPLNLHEMNDPQVHELLTPSDYVCPNGGKYKARALHHAVMISVAREDDWVIHLDEESCFDEETVKYIYAHCAKQEMSVLRGEKRWGNIGQGVIKYGCHEHPPNYLTTLADSIRVADDFGKFRVQYELHEPLIGMHGSFVVCQTAVEAAVGFDHGISGSITEDAYFALVARAQGVKFSWIDAFMYEQSPFNIMDFIRQRSRWFGGLVLVCLASAIPLKQRAVLCFMTLSWAVVPLVTLASVTNYLIGTSWSATTPAYTIATSVLAGISCWGYVLGFFWTFSPKKGWIRFFLLFYAQLILQPVFAIMEMSGVIHGIINPPSKGFYIVQKQADGNLSNTPTDNAPKAETA